MSCAYKTGGPQSKILLQTVISLVYSHIFLLSLSLSLFTLIIPFPPIHTSSSPVNKRVIMGALDHLSNIFDCSSGSSKLKKRKQLQVRASFISFFNYFIGSILNQLCRSYGIHKWTSPLIFRCLKLRRIVVLFCPGVNRGSYGSFRNMHRGSLRVGPTC
jgi:hypothetical protein